MLYQSRLSALTGYEKAAAIKVNKFFRKNMCKVGQFTKESLPYI